MYKSYPYLPNFRFNNVLDKHSHSEFYQLDRRTWFPYQLASSYYVDTFRQVFANFSFKDCLGYKVKEDDSEYKWLTYKEVHDLFTSFGSGLMAYLEPRDFVGIYAKNSVEWLMADMACVWYSLVSVPIHFALDDDSIEHVVNHSGVVCIIGTREYIKKIMTMDVPKVKLLVQIDPLQDEEIQLAKQKKLHLLYFYHLVYQGKRKLLPPIRTKHKDISTIYYTSGSTGTPKGVISNDLCMNGDTVYQPDNPSHVQIEYLPFGHAMGRDNFKRSCFLGGKLALFTRDMKYLFDETRIIRPTKFRGVPAVWHTLYEIYLQNLAMARQNQKDPDNVMELKERKRIEAMLGNRLRAVITGSAATSPAVIEFIHKTFPECMFYEGYGTTEASGIASNGNLLEGSYKLLDCPELGYFNSDKPYPRGELAVKLEYMFSGYYNDEQATKEAFTEDGYFKTGDIVERINPKSIKIIDRKKNFFKLANGEFIRAQYLESLFEESALVDQIFVTGAPFSKYFVVVVVPNMENVNNKLKMESRDDITIEKMVLDEIIAIATNKKLASYEVPRIVHISQEPFTIENLLLTSSLKRNRPVLTKHFHDVVMDLTKTKELLDMLESDFGATEISENENVMDLIGDSMSKVRFAYKLKEKFSKDVPVSYAYDKHTLSELVNYLNGKKENTKTDNIYEEFTEDFLNWKSLVQFSPSTTINEENLTSTTNVFLTGATGFLVRATDEDSGLAKLKSNLESLGILSNITFENIKIVAGDLSRPKLELTDDLFNELCGSIDIIVHNGAVVNWQLPYKEQRQANVFGTNWVLEIAKTHKIKPLVYVSTFSTHSTFGTPYDIESHRFLEKQGGYVLSKWLAEFCVRMQLTNFNHPIAIIRPGMITGHSTTGACNHTQFGYSIDSDGTMSDINPVDCLSATILDILHTLEGKQKTGKFLVENSVYNLANLKLASYNEASEACKVTRDDICSLPYDDWRPKVVSEDKNDQLYPLLPYFPANQAFRIRKARETTEDDQPEVKKYNIQLQQLSTIQLLKNQISHMNIDLKRKQE